MEPHRRWFRSEPKSPGKDARMRFVHVLTADYSWCRRPLTPVRSRSRNAKLSAHSCKTENKLCLFGIKANIPLELPLSLSWSLTAVCWAQFETFRALGFQIGQLSASSQPRKGMLILGILWEILHRKYSVHICICAVSWGQSLHRVHFSVFIFVSTNFIYLHAAEKIAEKIWISC